jgi:hypothetical protein
VSSFDVSWIDRGAEPQSPPDSAYPDGRRGKVKRSGLKQHTVIIDNPYQRVRRGHWVVIAAGQAFGFSPAEMRHLYSRVPL